MESPAWAIYMAMEHERIHLETSSVLIRELPLEYIQRPLNWVPNYATRYPVGKKDPGEANDFPRNPFFHVQHSSVELGKKKSFPSFGWDNEYGDLNLDVHSFDCSSPLISNGEFYEFVTAGGYTKPHFWSPDGWKWRASANKLWPAFWVQKGPAGMNLFDLRLPFEVVPMHWAYAVEVNYYEAKAFCMWKQEKMQLKGNSSKLLRLLTEAEHRALVMGTKQFN